ncbi:hypothetical protein ACFZB9_01180 [Kitasatospora sp. NPDC008050]|uniref:hypothetical protein n=1 Tax=Kitasatospora sp. NPDC008050 TaxID=3364021 RepID=UPI0036E6ABBD
MQQNENPSAMSLRVYRITPTGRRFLLSTSTISAGEPYTRPLTDVWPDCVCRRCDPLRRRRQPSESLAEYRVRQHHT